MTQPVATLETVRAACQEMIAAGEKITANGVLRRTQGSKSTVLKLLETVRPELAELASKAADPEIAQLHGLAAPFLRQLWASAKDQAAIEGQRQVSTLLTLQQGLLEDIQELRAENEALSNKLAEAEARAGDQESLVKRLEQLLPKAGHAPKALRTKASGSSVMHLLTLLASNKKALTKSTLDEQLMNQGMEASVAQKARYHAIERGLVAFSLTEQGRAKLLEGSQVA